MNELNSALDPVDPAADAMEPADFTEQAFEGQAFEGADTALAIVGLSGRFPGADDEEAFWQLLREGRSAIVEASAEELRASGVDEATAARPDYVPRGGFLSDVERFDAAFFGINPRDARVTDPQHRLFLEECWKALENAGYRPGARPDEGDGGAVGVYGGMNMASYLIHHLLGDRELLEGAGELLLRIHNDKDFLCSTVAYRLGFTGPAVTVQGACATSLMALCLACQGLLSYQCDMALAGGVSVRTPARGGYVAQEGVYAPDGRCRAFDAAARGTVLGNGVGVVVLKRLEDALAAGDTIRAVVRGFAMNNDGGVKAGYTAPSVDGQAEVVAMAQALAGVEASSISYVEAHGTGTPMGDPIEVEALTRAFRETSDGVGYCGLGSVKTNIGHLDAAAGVASVIKTVLALENAYLPPSLGFEIPNPEIPWQSSPFQVVAEGRPWQSEGPRRAGVSAFAVGGVNAHVVLEQAPSAAPSVAPPRRPQLLVLSAKSRSALDQAGEALAQRVAALPENGGEGASVRWADVAHTLAVGRQGMRWRRAVLADPRDPQAVLAALGSPSGAQQDSEEGSAEALPSPAPTFLGEVPGTAAGAGAGRNSGVSTVFLLPGLGEQRPGVAAALYRQEPVFRQAVEEGLAATEPHLAAGVDLRSLLLEAPAAEESTSGGDLRRWVRGEAAGVALPTAAAQPMMAVLELALARLWRSWGVEATALLGFSVGELVAAALAGVFSERDALALIAQRAALLDAQPPGAMCAVALPLSELASSELASSELASAQLLQRWGAAPDLTIAAEAAPQLTVVAGPRESVEGLEERLRQEGVAHRRLATAHAFHTPLLAPAVAELRQRVAAVPRHAPQLPVLSAVTGTWLRDEEAQDPDYWAQQAIRPVRFAAAAAALAQDARRWALLEVGPGQTLASWVLQQPARGEAPVAIPTLGDPRSGIDSASAPLAALGRLWVAGVEPDWPAVHGAGRRRVPLPSYPFEGESHWVSPEGEGRSALDRGAPDRGAPDRGAPDRGAGSSDAHQSSATAQQSAPLDQGAHVAIPLWRQEAPLERITKAHRERLQQAGPWLLVGAGGALEKALEKALRNVGASVARAELSVFGASSSSLRSEEGPLRLAADDAEAHEKLLRTVSADLGAPPRCILHFGASEELGAPGALARGFHSPLLLCRALALAAAGGNSEACSLVFFSAGLWSVTGAEPLESERALVLGPARAAAMEIPALDSRVVDLESGRAAVVDRALVATVLAEALDQVAGAGEGRDVALRGRQRWVREFRTLPDLGIPPQAADSADHRAGHPLAAGAPWLITGGLGGVGLTLARRLWRRCGARLALLGRSGLTSGAPHHRAAEAAVAQLRQEGAEVLVLQADVLDGDGLALAVGEVVSRFGSIAGVVHAAGESPGGLLATRTVEAVHRVLAPKVQGTAQLLAALEPHRPPLVVLCSSLTSIFGAPGLVDHASANAYLDAVAQESSRRGGSAVIAVNWDTWLEVGQAARAARGEVRSSSEASSEISSEVPPEVPSEPPSEASTAPGAAAASEGSGSPLLGSPSGSLPGFSHPLLQWAEAGEREWRFGARLEAASCWPLDEHRIAGRATLPGTTVLDLLWSAAVAAGLETPVEIRQLAFEAPLMAPDEGAVEIRLRLAKAEGGEFSARLESLDAGGVRTVHARAELGPGTAAAKELPASGAASWENLDLEAPEDLALGPRWGQQRGRWSRQAGTVDARLSLSPDHADDLQHWRVHPALMDRAVGAAVAAAASGGDAYLPMAYGRVVFYRPLPAALEVRARFDESKVGAATFSCDLWLVDSEGAAVAAVEDFLLRRVTAAPAASASAASSAGHGASGHDVSHLLQGLSPERAAEAFEALLREPRLWPQVSVTARPLEALALQARAAASGAALGLGESPPLDAPEGGRRRPPLAVDFVAPRSDLEEQLAAIWRGLLGLSSVGVEDGFFDLGGDSLLATRLLTQVSETFSVRLGLKDIFEGPTIGAMARRIVALEAAGAEDEELLAAVAELKGLSLDEARALLAQED
ncbi:MAG: SDR family NAD(P)-dependent oxidoreductase [Acidobacteriota bacterium]